MSKPQRFSFSSRFAFYLLAVGSACGLGNLWRFPYIVGENGGGAFLLLYVFLALTVGLTLMIAELMIGRSYRMGILGVTKKVSTTTHKSIKAFGWLSLIISILTLSYYSVICGWVLHYLTQFILSLMQPSSEAYLAKLSVGLLQKNGWLQFLLASVHLLVSVVIVFKGFEEGFERWVSSLIPIFFLLVVMLLVGSLSLDSTPDVLRFLFYPDFSKLNLKSLGHALGHVFFTLSLGFGIMVTFGSYFKDHEHIPSVGLRVTLVDTFVSIISVLLIFPIAFSTSKTPLTDPSLLFEVFPQFLSSFKGGVLFGIFFFLCLWLAAINASVGLLEGITANVIERRPQFKRSKSVILSGLAILFVTILPALSGTLFEGLKILGHSIIELFDLFLINGLLPVACLGIAIVAWKGLEDKDKKSLFLDLGEVTSHAMYSHWLFFLKWVVPSVIVLGLALQFINLFV